VLHCGQNNKYSVLNECNRMLKYNIGESSLDDRSAQVYPYNIFNHCSVCRVDCKFTREKNYTNRKRSDTHNSVFIVLLSGTERWLTVFEKSGQSKVFVAPHLTLFDLISLVYVTRRTGYEAPNYGTFSYLALFHPSWFLLIQLQSIFFLYF
jgi:hypothetical protein